MIEERKKIIYICSTAVFVIVAYWILLAKGRIPKNDKDIYKLALKDKLNRILFEGIPITGWSLTHIWLYSVLGYMFPREFWPLMFAGIIWELFEWLMGKLTEPKLKFEHFMKELQEKFPNTDFDFANKIYKSFWGGNITDILMNFIGFCIGFYLRSIFKWTGIEKIEKTKF